MIDQFVGGSVPEGGLNRPTVDAAELCFVDLVAVSYYRKICDSLEAFLYCMQSHAELRERLSLFHEQCNDLMLHGTADWRNLIGMLAAPKACRPWSPILARLFCSKSMVSCT